MFISEFLLTSILFATILRCVNAYSGQGAAADRVPPLARYASRFCQLSRLGADSLVPRPFHFFIPCSVKRWRGEAWSMLSREWRHICLGRQRSPPSKEQAWGVILYFLPRELEFRTLTKLPLQVQCVLSIGDPSSVYLSRHWHNSCDKMDQAFPSVFAYCKRSETGRCLSHCPVQFTWPSSFWSLSVCTNGGGKANPVPRPHPLTRGETVWWTKSNFLG